MSLPTFAGWVFPPDFPPNDAGAIAEIRDLYLKNIQPELRRELHTPDGDWNELAVHGSAAGLVLGLEFNYRGLTPANRRLTFNAIGMLLLRAIRDRAGLGEPVPDQVLQTPVVTFKHFVFTPDDRVRLGFEKLLGDRPISPISARSAAGLIAHIAAGRFLKSLREDAVFFRNEASNLLYQALGREPPFAHATFSFDEARMLVSLLRELRGPDLIEHLDALRNQPDIVNKFAAEGHACEYELAQRKISRARRG